MQAAEHALKIPIIVATGIHKTNLNLILTRQLANISPNNPIPISQEDEALPNYILVDGGLSTKLPTR